MERVKRNGRMYWMAHNSKGKRLYSADGGMTWAKNVNSAFRIALAAGRGPAKAHTGRSK